MSEIMTGISQTIARVAGELQPYLTPAVEVKLLCEALRPERSYPTDAGANLRSFVDAEIYPGEMKMIDTGVAIKIPTGFMGMVVPRSSQGKIKISLANTTGIIDSTYEGNIKLLLVNGGEDPYIIEACKTKVAQLIIIPVMLASFINFRGIWNESIREEGGFGSTGV